MGYVSDMISTHPQTIKDPKKSLLISAIQSCFDCAQACVSCADACLGENDPKMLKNVIRSTNDSSDICLATGKVLSRLNDPQWDVLRSQVQACIQSVRTTGMLCQEHARMHEHCRICTDSCRECEGAMGNYLETIQ